MTPEEQRIAIAEACGWRREPHSVGTRLINPDGWVVNNNYSESWRLPDYLNDLNAMHEAEKVLIGDEPENSELWCDFQTNLVIACPAYLSYYATASQRAEAFLRTIGKWEEAK